MIYAKVQGNVVREIIACDKTPPGYREFDDDAPIDVGDDIRFFDAQGFPLSAASAVTAGLITVSSNQVAVWEGGRYVVKDDYTAGNYWSKQTKALVKLSLGERPGTDITDLEPPHEKAKWQVDKWVIPEAAKAADARSKRDELLGGCDFIMLSDHPATNKAAWKTYRQELRDVPEQAGFPDAITWPTKPAEPKIR